MSSAARVTYIYEKACTFCGAAFESRRHDAIQCKRCKWKRRQAAYKARYPDRVLAQKRAWNAAHLDVRRAHRKASYWRHAEKNRERCRRWHADGRRNKQMKSWEFDLARKIREIAIV